MKNKLYTTICHPEFVEGYLKISHCVRNDKKKVHIEPSLRVAQRIEKSRSSNFKILSFLFLLSSFFSQAQNYQWDWAMSGGGIQGVDQIYDVKVGADNNYYFIASLHGTIGTQLDDVAINTNNNSLGGEDIFIFSTTCDGQVRWSQAIGGAGTGDSAYNIALDSNNNVYVGARVGFSTNSSFPVRFSDTETLPTPTNPASVSEGWKTSFIVKYNNMGQYQWKKAVQGDVTQANFESCILNIAIDNQDNLHFIVGLGAGNHLDGQVTVPTTFTNYTYQYYLVKFNTQTQQFADVLLLPTTGKLEPNNTRFVYNEATNIYYLSSIRESLMPFSYDNKPIINRTFLLAIRGFNSNIGTDGEELWRREIYSQPTNGQSIAANRIFTLKVDSNSDIYIGGNIFKSQNETNLKIYDPTDPTTIYNFTPGADWTIPFIAKLNSSGIVQWVQTTAAYNANALTPGPRYGSGIAIRDNEVAFGSQGANEFWDNIEIQNPVSHQPDPILIRFNKQTGNVIAIHEIPGSPSESQQSIALAVDNDGNYISTGIFTGGLFINTGSNVPPVLSVGNTDFFVAKLAASVCGTAVSTDKFNKLNVNVYPNPTNDVVNIETQENLQSYEVYNVLGQQVQKGMFNNNNQINLHGAASGNYFIKVTTQQGSTATVQVVKN